MKILLSLILLLGAVPAMAVSLQSGKTQIDINAYFDLDVNYMTEMPMAMTCTASSPCTMNGMSLTSGNMIMNMDEVTEVDQNHMNFVVSTRTGKLKTRLNMESRHSYSSFDSNTGNSGNTGTMGQSGEMGSFRIAEVYGDYSFSSSLKVKMGQFYAPFGIYNEYRYITPLFATVVLPFLYELPPNYGSAPIFPSNANILVHGSNYITDSIELKYGLYGSGGQRNLNSKDMGNAGFGREAGNDKGVGLRLRTTYNENYSLGLSYYTVREDGAAALVTTGADLELMLPGDLKFEAEYAQETQDDSLNRWTYYGRFIFNGFSGWRPYLTYDVFNDRNHVLYKFEQSRIGLGAQFNLHSNVTVKAEYHAHSWKDTPTVDGYTGMMMKMTSKGKDTTDMVRISTIFLF